MQKIKDTHTQLHIGLQNNVTMMSTPHGQSEASNRCSLRMSRISDHRDSNLY